jgi:uncharacterized membrane protein (UPF0127 family)
MKKYLIYVFILTIVVLGLISWRIFFSDKKQDADIVILKREISGPVLKKEGKLFFLDYQSKDTLSSIVIEIADTPDEINKGMMYRTQLEADQGMLFLFESEEYQSFWMKNTKISLDIIFINSNYQIVHIAKHTIPYSKDPIPSMKPARYVLEVNAGYCDKHAINEQDYIYFNQDNSLSL